MRTEIPLSKSKIFLLLLIAAAFLTLGYWMFNMDASEIESHRKFNSPLFVHGLGLVSIVMGGLGGFVAIRKLFDPSPGLIIDELGITDNSSAFSAGFIPWKDIIGFEIRQIHSQRILYVLLSDPEKYIARFKPLKRALLGANMKIAASPVAITASTLKIGFDLKFAQWHNQFFLFKWMKTLPKRQAA